MNVKMLACSILAGLFLISCDDDTSGLGGSLIPDSDMIKVSEQSYFAVSRTILSPDSILAKTTQCNIGHYTDPLNGTVYHSDYLTQLNCPENFAFPDSVFGIGGFNFPDWFKEKMEGVKPYYANLRIYYTSFFGDSTNTIDIDVFPLDKMIDAGKRYYPGIDPSEFYDCTSAPIASMTLSALNFLDSDSARNESSSYYPSVSIRLPDEFAFEILDKYYQQGGPEKCFRDASAFMENICKGFYLRCSRGDGTVIYIDKSVLEVNFKCIDPENPDQVSSYMAEFSGNNEVMQMNCFSWTGLDTPLSDPTCTWVLSPYGLLTEITLPVDEMKNESGVVLNSATLSLSSMVTPSQRIRPSAPPRLMLVRKDVASDFFDDNKSVDNIESFGAVYTSKTGVYTFANIAPLIEKAYSDRAEWLEEKGLQDNAASRAAYAAERPDWDKVMLIPITPQYDANNSIIGYIVDLKMRQLKLVGGPQGQKLKIKTIYSRQ